MVLSLAALLGRGGSLAGAGGLSARSCGSTPQRLRTMLLWLVVAGPLLLLAGGLRSARIAAAAAALAIIAFAGVGMAWNTGEYRSPCHIESDYYCIRILETTSAADIRLAR